MAFDKPAYFAHSHSRRSDWRKCPHMAYHKYVLKSVKFEQNAAMARGDNIHKAMENRVRLDVPLPQGMERYEPVARAIGNMPGQRYVELNLALDRNLQPCGTRDWNNCWIRAKADVLTIKGDRAWDGDYKTGKPTDDEDQLILSAAMVFHTYPDVNVVTASYLWLDHDSNTTRRYTRSQLDEMWAPILDDFREIQDNYVKERWPAKPDAFSCGYCDVNKAKLCGFAKVPYKGR